MLSLLLMAAAVVLAVSALADADVSIGRGTGAIILAALALTVLVAGPLVLGVTRWAVDRGEQARRDRKGQSPTASDDTVLQRYENQLGWYERQAAWNRSRNNRMQVTAVVLAGISPVVVAWTELPTAVKALPSALAAITIGTSGVFQRHRNYVRQAVTAERLKAERFRFDSCIGAYEKGSPEERRRRLAVAIEEITSSETAAWAQDAAVPIPATRAQDAAVPTPATPAVPESRSSGSQPPAS